MSGLVHHHPAAVRVLAGMCMALLFAGCGVPGDPRGDVSHFRLGCAHDLASCSSCHPAEQPLGPLDPSCTSCHQEDRPASHPEDPASCESCHAACSWDDVERAHPEGFADAAAHGTAANLTTAPTGDCTACHGADLRGAVDEAGFAAPGCDDCHASSGHPDWRTDCTFCHGGEDGDVLGAPPEDLDNETRAALLSFSAHQAHVADGDHPVWGCETCHVTVSDLLQPGHLFDRTPAVSEVDFSGGLSAGASWNGTTCADAGCHGNGIQPGTIADGTTPLSCDGCHGTTPAAWDLLSPVHTDHLLADPSISCADCHQDNIDPDGDIIAPYLHVDGTLQVDFAVATLTAPAGPQSCTGSCHGVEHAAGSVGHPPGYDAADVHGLDANLGVSDCTDCHGADLEGTGSVTGCDDCHASSGHPDWRTDCTFCHGGQDGDVLGAPPEDLDNETRAALISFSAHQAHVADGDHPVWGCETCHVTVSDLLQPGHLFDLTPAVSEVDFSGGLSAGASWNGTTCADAGCHGNGIQPGTVADGTTPLSCDGCHGTTPAAWDLLSPVHTDHLLADPTISCADCHQDNIDPDGDIIAPYLHVDGTLQVDFAVPTLTAPAGPQSCTGSCHGVEHTAGSVGHPPGYDAADVHGLDANLGVSDCTDCHGADLEGTGSVTGCDDCHASNGHPDWRTDCTFCHGGQAGDVLGAPPEDLDNETRAALISFSAHQAHVADGDHPVWGCETCHVTVSDLLQPGHLFDLTPAVSEVDFSGGLSAGARWNGTTCADAGCHGNGLVPGTVADGTTPLSCDGCHGTTPAAWDLLSPVHTDHLLADPTISCADCHQANIDPDGDIIAPFLHVDGTLQVAFSVPTLTAPAGPQSCTGNCHGVDHTAGSVGHPPGYDAADVHGLDANLGVSDCTDCHGADLEGTGSVTGCDDCHASSGHPDWRTDCTFCHGGQGGDVLGAPPEDLDNETRAAVISFSAHQAHVADGDHPVWGCETCHVTVSDLLQPGHLFDLTPAVSEVDFSGGLSAGATWNGTTCADAGCHGNGLVPGTVADGTTPLSCDGCHGTTPAAWDLLSPVHTDHLLADPTISCADCHQDNIDPDGDIIAPFLHVDGTLQVDFSVLTLTAPAGPQSCTGSCHGVEHTAGSVGHPPGYDAADVHGLDANLGVSTCTDCHGADLEGTGSVTGCDDCHASSGHPDWRTDCTFCHGGQDGDVLGAPPEDLDNETRAALISFSAHQAHVADGDHPVWGCETCHVTVSDLLQPGHLFDLTPAVSEVDFSGGLSAGARWNGTTCADAGCHGNGLVPGTVADGTTALSCDGCHGTTPAAWDLLSPVHTDHLLADPTISCADCHHATIDDDDDIVAPTLHVDGTLQVAFSVATLTAPAGPQSCTGSCHGVDHTAGSVGHPPGYDAADVHGLDANLGVSTCTDCHGADLEGTGSVTGCDDCHASNGHPDWRTDCTFCHGGQAGDVLGAPPEDIDNETRPALISFSAHQAHADTTSHAFYACGTCHGAPADGYRRIELDLGHWLDATPGRSELAFTGLGAGITWNGTTCARSGCHGNGLTTASVNDGTTPLSCKACHPDQTSNGDAWDRMSGEHKKHLEENSSCSECHATVVTATQQIIGPADHVDGAPDVAMRPGNGVTWSANGRCTGSCHGESHQAEGW